MKIPNRPGFESKNVDYAFFEKAVYGLSTEVFTFEALSNAYLYVKDDFSKEHAFLDDRWLRIGITDAGGFHSGFILSPSAFRF